MPTRFSFEVPIKHLHDFEDMQDFYFTLSFLYAREEYRRYVQEKVEEGVKCVWLDNSYNELETADNSYKMIDLWSAYNPHRVISPDDPRWSIDKIQWHFAQMNRTIRSHELVCVVNTNEMMQAMKAKGARHFAYSYHCRGDKLYQDMEWAKDCHFLGLISPQEVMYIRPPTCDTSMPIKLALQNKTFTEWVREGCTHQHTKDIPSFFDVELTKRQMIEARDNIRRLKEMVNGRG